jgi:hypothetical protein
MAKSILDPSFKWIPSAATDVRATFERVKREREEAEKKRKEAEALQSRILKWRGNGSR